jgi:K+-sensing histidine kinase KdpD
MLAMSERSDADVLQDLQTRFAAFTSACSHDLRTASRNVGTLCEMLTESGAIERLSEEDAELWAGVISESKRMTAILDGIVQYARVPVRAKRDVVDVGHLIRAQWLGPESGLTLDALPEIVGEAALLATLVHELISNVVRYAGGRPPCLHVYGERQEGWVELHFADQGMGIPEGQEQAVFAVLQRCHPKGGVGAGLAVCERIVAAHGGSIRVAAGRNDGATLIVRLPDCDPST